MNKILIRPVITEKSMAATSEGIYVFRVAKSANKPQIAKAIENLYKVKVEKINIINLKEERLLVRGKFPAKKRAWKKAVVKLEKGQKISAYEEKKNA